MQNRFQNVWKNAFRKKVMQLIEFEINWIFIKKKTSNSLIYNFRNPNGVPRRPHESGGNSGGSESAGADPGKDQTEGASSQAAYVIILFDFSLGVTIVCLKLFLLCYFSRKSLPTMYDPFFFIFQSYQIKGRKAFCTEIRDVW